MCCVVLWFFSIQKHKIKYNLCMKILITNLLISFNFVWFDLVSFRLQWLIPYKYDFYYDPSLAKLICIWSGVSNLTLSDSDQITLVTCSLKFVVFENNLLNWFFFFLLMIYALFIVKYVKISRIQSLETKNIMQYMSTVYFIFVFSSLRCGNTCFFLYVWWIFST